MPDDSATPAEDEARRQRLEQWRIAREEQDALEESERAALISLMSQIHDLGVARVDDSGRAVFLQVEGGAQDDGTATLMFWGRRPKTWKSLLGTASVPVVTVRSTTRRITAEVDQPGRPGDPTFVLLELTPLAEHRQAQAEEVVDQIAAYLAEDRNR